MRLAGMATVVTGAGSGIGRAVARRFVAEGAKVVAVIRDSAEAAALTGEGCHVVVGDVALATTNVAAVAAAIDRFGRLDCFVANAGVWDFHKRVARQSAADISGAFDEIMRTNVLGLLLGAHAAIDPLRATRGSIIATGSNASFLAGGGGAIYTASKFALRGAIMQLAQELAPEIRVNGVAPGATDTALGGPAALGQDTKKMNADRARIDGMAAHIPLGRVSMPEDHAGLYVTLASGADSGYVTGAMFRSDGGITSTV